MKYGAKEDREFAIGNSAIPLIFLCLSSVLNIILCIWLVAGLGLGVAGSPLRGRVTLSHRHFPVLCWPMFNHLCLAAFSPAAF